MSVILLVDDNDEIREIFTLFLSMRGHTVHSAPGGRECLEMLKTLHPDIILLDIMMPGMNGWETLCAIKQNPATQHLPVTMCSGKLPDIEEINRYGNCIEDYLVKPQKLSLLPNTLAGIIQRSLDRKGTMERLKNEIPDHHLIDEFYDCLKKLYLLEKFSRFFTPDPEKIESAIQCHKSRMYEIRDLLDHPVLFRVLEMPREIPGIHADTISPMGPGIRVPEVRPDDLMMQTPHEGATGLRYEL